jgi:OOP family OmpA-OmpF porin
VRTPALALILLVVGGMNAVAADLPVKAPPALPNYGWAGPYVGGGGGVNWMSDVGRKPDFSPIAGPGTLVPADLFAVETAVGGVAFANAGWAFGNGLRVEAEVNYRSNNAGSVRTTYPFATTNDNRTGRISSESVMANVLYDIGSTKGWPVYLTVGGGIGYASVNYDNVSVRALDGIGGYQTFKLNDTTGGFAWQYIVGATVPIRTMPGLELSAEYRHFSTTGHDFGGTVVQGGLAPPTTIVATANGRINADYTNDSVLFGVRYKFGMAGRPQ